MGVLVSTLSPNMSLSVPTVGVDVGPTFAYQINTSLNILDAHNHSPGNGVQIPPSGLNINSALTFQNQQATNMGAVLFQDQTSLATLNALYTKAGELWFNDPTNPVQITSGGAVNATSSGISSGSASAAFSAGVLQVYSNLSTSTPGNIQGGSLLLGNNVANSNFLTLSPPSLTGGGWTLTLPAIPGSTSFLTLDTGGNITGSVPATAGITGSNIATATITGTNIAAATLTDSLIEPAVAPGSTAFQGIAPNKLDSANTPYYIAGSNSGTFTTSSGSFVDVTNQSVTLPNVSHTRPVFISFYGSNSSAEISVTGTAAFRIIANGSAVNLITEFTLPGGTYAPSIFNTMGYFFHSVGSTTQVFTTYTLQAAAVGGGSAAGAVNIQMQVFQV